MKGFLQLLTGAAAVCTALAAPVADTNSVVTRRDAAIEAKRTELTDIAKRSEIAENSIIWIVVAYSDEQKGADQQAATKHKRDALPAEQENDIILLLVEAYSDEAEGADAAKIKMTKRAIMNKLNA